MKRFFGLLGVVALAVCLPLVAVAGDYHTGSTLVCSDCHVMHYSQSHGYNADGSGYFTPLGSGGPYEYLLRNDVNDLCLTCHDGSSFAPDVYGPNTNGYVRQAGALNRLGDGNEATGHTLDATTTAPGSNPPWNNPEGLECVDCHQPHGYNPNGNPYRNLTHEPGNESYGQVFVSYSTGTWVDSVDVYQVAAGPMATHYSYDNVFFNEPDPTKSHYAEFCKGCHTNFHGDKGGSELGGATGEGWLRHPTNDADIGALGGGHSNLAVFTSHTNRVQVMSASGQWDPPAADNTPSCMTCHKAHGNQNAFGLIFMAGTGTVTEEGDDGTSVTDLCKQCHVQGG
jgi:hypothetical protein